VFLPLTQLAVTRAVPGHLAFGAALGRQGATFLALRILHEIFEYFARVQFNETAHVCLLLCAAFCEECASLYICDLAPVLIGEEACADLRNHLHNKCIGCRERTGSTLDVELFEATEHVGEHGELVEQCLVHKLAEAEKVLLAEIGHRVLASCVFGHEHIVDSEPDLRLYLGELSTLMRLDHGPLLIFKLFFLILCIHADPRLQFKQGHEHTRDVIILHHLVDDRQGKSINMIGDEPDQAEASHRAFEVDFIKLCFHFLLLRLVDTLLGGLVISPKVLAILECLAFLHHVRELAIAVVNELNKGVISSLAG